MDVVIPTLGESVTEASIGQWLKKPGDAVKADEPIVSLETDKVAVEVNAPADGVLTEQLFKEGDTVQVGAVVARLAAGATAAAAPAAAPTAAPVPAAAPAPAAAPSAPTAPAAPSAPETPTTGPTARRKAAEGTPVAAAAPASPLPSTGGPGVGARTEERVRMTRLRQTIARRLKEAQNTAAMLTTFNDVDMSAVMEARNRYKDSFEKKHGVRLGFMSFFVKACALAAKDVPSVNARIDGDEIVFHDYMDVGVAVSGPGGLIVPILKDAQAKGFADIEREIADFGKRARDGQLKIEELQGGTFTISNGGVFGSLMSTPILNPPQSGVLGMHRIEDRPVVVNGQIVIRPMMYLALSYDHRLIDGREAVTFLVRVKEALEDPVRLLIDL
ncbi:MAG: 2-oxoglutarate dehydrogenase complex dihydrolipoyllysine-residue succinyltransferase [Sandaracinobacter sp.]